MTRNKNVFKIKRQLVVKEKILFSHLLSLPLSSSLEADDLAQYLDHLLAHAAPKKPKRQVKGLCRFKAVATKTKEMVTLMNKAQDLNVHSE